ncbi:macrophage mannose receptor 1-like isoform X2 [Gouania willdenowi]|uniref:macrophage mannose receptor 1-like isoform X2 n=1 Tax=Gouania willdenowi TaxID=441366 RepID=UPI0010566FE8|nr:macrophage mannose receptor 1-like isoform X2 [Gouania willdenowi]
MARILLALMCLSGWSYSTCLQYHYVADQKTWTEAQTYCRQTYADLATIGKKEQNDQILDTITSAGQSSEVWMGLYSTIDWRWSDGFLGVGANYSNWGHGHPNFAVAAEFCVLVGNVWYDVLCSDKARFVCYNGENMKNQNLISMKYNYSVRISFSKTLMIVSTGSQLDPEVFFVNSYETWPVAQKYCRENYVDLVTVTNIKVVEKINSETGGSVVWIGLHRAPNFFWSDGSNFTFSNWDFVYNMLNSMKVICAVTSSTKGGKWKFLSCEEKLPFVCYSIPHAYRLQLKITSGNSALDLNDPAVKKDLLKKLEERLKSKVERKVTLKWRNPQDGKVFKKLHTVVDSNDPEDCNGDYV